MNRTAVTAYKFAIGFVVLILGGLWLSDRYREANREAREGDCTMHLKQIALALLNYQDKYGSLPPVVVADGDGKPLHSWRVLILPFLGGVGEEVYAKYDFNEPWNGPHNSRLQAELPEWFAECFHCPDGRSDRMMTNYFVVTGPETLWPGTTSGVIEAPMRAASPEVLVIELPDSNINWMEPRDISVADVISRLESLSDERGAIHPRGIQYVDTGQRRHAFPRFDRLLLRKLLTIGSFD